MGLNSTTYFENSLNKGRFAIFGGIGFIVSSLAILASAAIWTWIRYNPEKFET